MQETPAAGASSNPVTPLPTAAQVHQGQIQDYELLLSFMRLEITSRADFQKSLIRPRTYSPLNQENETGQIALQQLLEDSDYRALCKSHNVSPHYLTVTIKEGAYVYETSNREGENKTILNLSGNPKWKNFRTHIEKSVQLLSGQIRHDRLIPVFRMATFYGITPWDPTHADQHQAAIDALEEKIAGFRLGLEEDFNILDFRPSPVKHSLKSSHAGLSAAAVRSQVRLLRTHYGLAARDIKRILQTYLPDGKTSLLTHLAGDILSSATVEQIRARPTAFLQKILESPEAETLGTHLLSAMDWYGGKPGEESSPRIRTKVVANALEIWFQSPPTDIPVRIAGYDFQARTHWGKSYPSIRGEFETHLLSSKQASSEKEAIVIARLFLRQFPAEFSVSDIPSDLPYRSSVVWVNFVNGVNLINATDPGALNRFNFEQLTRLPLEQSEGATAEQLENIGMARLLPTLDWAVSQGIIAQKQREAFTQLDIERAQAELDKHIATLNDAIIQLNKEPPKRLSIAQTAVDTNLAPKLNRLETTDKHWYWKEHLLARKRHDYDRGKDTPTFANKAYDYYSAADVVASGKFDDRKPWHIAKNDHTVTTLKLSIDEYRNIQSEGFVSVAKIGPTGTLPDVKKQFDEEFLSHLQSLTAAYATLINNLLASLPYSDRKALELGELKIYTLRQQTFRVEAKHETPEKLLPLRTRNGLLLVTTFNGLTNTIELLPRAGIIRRIDNLAPNQFGGVLTYENWPAGMYSHSVETLSNRTLPFDWDAHATGVKPKSPARCEAIVEQLGHTFLAPSHSIDEVPVSINSSRGKEISNFIATQLLYQDPKVIRATGYGETALEREDTELEKLRENIKAFVPFWKNIDDLASGDPQRIVNGAFGLSMEVAPFASPIGKFAAGSLRLIVNPGRLALSMRLPAFASTIKQVMILTLQALNPADMAVSLFQILGAKGLKLVRFGVFRIQQLRGKAGHYDFTRSLPRIRDAGNWKPLASGDQLARIRGIDDVPVRSIVSTSKTSYRLIDPLSSRPYGPAINASTDELLLGRSHYRTLENNDHHTIVELTRNSRVQEVLEVDGRTTLFIDDQPYRLQDGVLRRADLVEDAYKTIPCRPPRAPRFEVCRTSYVLRDPAPTPDIGSFDNTKGWAPWFGDLIYTPATGKMPIRISALRTKHSLQATMEFQKGIYGRFMVSIPVAGEPLVDNIRAGAIIVEAMDGSKHYVFMRLDAGDFYVAECAKGQSLTDMLTFNKATTPPTALEKELRTVYTGSLLANNMVRIHGQPLAERALKAIDDIAISIGGHANPPETLKWLKVDTSPAEAILFDHSTRMIVRTSVDGAATWSLSRAAPDSVRETTAEIFNTLFARQAITFASSTHAGPGALRIDDTMMQLQRLISSRTGRPVHHPRNIAFAEIKTKTGAHEVYVSVSGQQGDTAFLPLFAKNPATHEVSVGSTRYINIDRGTRFPQTALSVTPEGKLQAIPHTIDNIENYTPALTSRPTSLDTESKLISVIRSKYPDPKQLDSITIATTLAPCDSCSVVIKQFGYDGSPGALDVIWK